VKWWNTLKLMVKYVLMVIAGHRLASSMGVDLQYFQGTGKDISVGDIYVEGNVV
jgi:formylmethanofuran dehydrogenase subunit C